MLSRALIVLLIVLNVGVALWWATLPKAVLAPVAETPSGVARLQLLSEVPPRVTAPPPAATAMATAAPPLATPAESPKRPAAQRCYAIGPFANTDALAAARAQLQPQVATLRVRDATASTARGWRVVVPPLADRAAAQALAQRIQAAGFNNYFVMADGDDANGIALGRYGSESVARQREAALRTAGFQAQAQPLGESGPRSWLDIAVTDAAFDPARARQAAGAAQANQVDCTSLH